MPIFITQGRYSRAALKGMAADPEDRSAAVAELCRNAGGRLIDYYVTLGEYDFCVITEMPDLKAVSAVAIAAAAGGGVSSIRTTAAMTASEAKEAFAQAGGLAASFRSAGGT